ncbi:MAG TPA: DUF3108 domain-containing protein [Steroidobacteraceae bacterium]|nr:DUF3108 domain-containing protein [Steroidobacteraceae bacterium]
MLLASRRGLPGLTVLPLALAALGVRAEGPTVQPFTATYALEWHGITAGESTLALKQTSPTTYDYSSTNRAHGLFRVVFPDPINEESTFKVEGGHVMPLSYREDNGADRAKQNVMLEFDWSAKRVRGTAEEKPVDQPLAPGTQDPLSVQIELMRDLRAGEAPTQFLLFDKHEAKQYDYTRDGNETLDTPLGRLDTVIYRSGRSDSSVVTRLWLAPTLGYVPLQAERRRHGKVDLSLHIRQLKQSS